MSADNKKKLYSKEPINIEDIKDPEDLNLYKQNQKISFTCPICHKRTVKYRINYQKNPQCAKCIRMKTFETIDWKGEVHQKVAKTKEERYGDPNYVNPKKIQESLNSKSPEEKKEIYDKVQKTNQERYGGHPAARPEQIERTQQTCQERYGCISPSQVPEFKEKYVNTCKERYGYENTFQVPEFKEKSKHTLMDKMGVDNCQKSEDVRNKSKETCMEKYGVPHPWSNHDVRVKCQQKYLYHGIFFDSSWELVLYIYLTEHNIDFKYQPDIYYCFDNTRYFPDFEIEGQMYEIKGEQFFEGDKMINPYDRSQDALYEDKHKCMIDNRVNILRLKDMQKYFDYVNEKYTGDFVKLFKTDLEFPFLNQDLKLKNDDGLIQAYHKSVYYANRKGFRSPYDAWADKNLIEKAALNRLKYTGKCRPGDVLYGFNVAKIAPKVSVFSPALATRLVHDYLNKYDTIFDPFSGFSGRLLGTLNNNKKYIGSDISGIHVSEANEIIRFKHAEDFAYVYVDDVLKTRPKEYECLFTCPPYNDKEQWNSDDVNKSCDEWIDICLEKFSCETCLFVVDDTEKYRDYIVETIENKSHFSVSTEYVILIQNKNY